jgi:hypothetical protein
MLSRCSSNGIQERTSIKSGRYCILHSLHALYCDSLVVLRMVYAFRCCRSMVVLRSDRQLRTLHCEFDRGRCEFLPASLTLIVHVDLYCELRDAAQTDDHALIHVNAPRGFAAAGHESPDCRSIQQS